MSLRMLFAIHGPADPLTAVFMNVMARADYLRGQGHTVDVATPADFAVGRWSRLQPLLLPVALAGGGGLRGYDVVIFHSHLAWAHLAARLPASRPRPAAIVSFHGLEPLYHEAVAAELARTGERLSRRFEMLHRRILPRLLQLACRRADRVLCLNSRERSYVVSRRWAEPERVAVVGNGVAREFLAIERTYPPAARRLLFTGQWLRPKGTRYLAKAFESIAAASPDAELTCLGTVATPERVLEDFAPPVRNRVRVVPRIDRRQLADELGRADLFLFPSLSEGFSGALLEALAAGLPVIATPAGAAPDLLEDGANAVCVPFADADALASAALRLMDDAPLRERLGLAGRRTAARHEWDAANAAFEAEIHAAVRKP